MANKIKNPALYKFLKTGLWNNKDVYDLYQDPTRLGFKIFFDFFTPNSPLLNSAINTGTALGYLRNRGYTEREYYLQTFINHLKKINDEYPFYFQSISGLDKISTRNYSEDKFTPIYGGVDKTIEIECLESIDLRMTALMDLYRKAAYDWEWGREIIPENLRRFSVDIFVYEIMDINRTGTVESSGFLNLKGAVGLGNTYPEREEYNTRLLGINPFSGSDRENVEKLNRTAGLGLNSDIVTGISRSMRTGVVVGESPNTPNPNINGFHFTLSGCHFHDDNIKEIFSGVKNDAPEIAKTKMVFYFMTSKESNTYNLFSDRKVSDEPENSITNKNTVIRESYGISDITNPKYGQLLPYASIAADKVENRINSVVNAQFLGNVYGISPNNLIQEFDGIQNGDPTKVVSATKAAFTTLERTRSIPQPGKKIGNVFE